MCEPFFKRSKVKGKIIVKHIMIFFCYLALGMHLLVSRDFLDLTPLHLSQADFFHVVLRTKTGKNPVPENTHHSEKTNILAPGDFQTHKPITRMFSDPRLRPRGT